MALAKSSVIFWSLMIMMMTLCGGSMAAVHKVGGDSAGWTAQTHVDYSKWASTNNFHVGDTLLFAYNGQFHNVLQVTKQDFQSCNATSPIATYTTGSDSVQLRRPGNFYFLCGFPGHCLAGQKVYIKVTLASTSPSSAPSASAPSLSPPSAVTEPTPTSNAPILHSSGIWSAVTVIAVLLVTGFAY